MPTKPKGENTTVEQLQSEVSDLEKLLNELKTKTFSDTEREKKEKDAKSKAEKLKGQIDALSKQEGIDPKLAEEKEKAKVLLESYEKTLGLKSSIKDKSAEGRKTDSKESSNKPASTEKTQVSTQTETESPAAEGEEKGFFGKAGDWIGEQWSDVTSGDKWKEEPGKNILRAVGFGVTGYAIYKGVKKLWNRAFGKKDKDKESDSESSSESSSKKDDSSEEKSFWDKPVGKFIKGAGAVLGVGTGVYYVAHGLYTKNRGLKDLWDREKGKKLEFDDALKYASGAVANQDNKEGMGYGLDLKYHEDTSEIEAYGEKIKIDKDKRKIDGLNIEFKKYENMICTAIVIAYLKKTYSGKCANNDPFHFNGNWQGDIDVNTGGGGEEAIDGTGNQGRILGVGAAGIAGILTGIFGGPQAGLAVGGVGGVVGYAAGSAIDHNNIMNDVMPELDNEYGKKVLSGYLNNMKCREARNQTKEDISESPIKDRVWEFVKQIQKDNQNLTAIGGRSKFDAIQDSTDKNKYIIKAYGREISAEVTGSSGKEEIRILGISGGIPAIKADTSVGNISSLKLPLKEGLYMVALITQFVEKFHHKGLEYPYFDYTWKTGKILSGMRKFYTFQGKQDYKGIYFNDKESTINPLTSDFWSVDSTAYSRLELRRNMPTIFADDEKLEDGFIKFLNDGITDKNNVSIWRKP